MAKVTVKLYGILDVIDNPISLEVDNTREAIAAVLQHIKRVAPEKVNLNNLRFQVRGYDTEESLEQPIEDGKVLHIMPSLGVGKKGGFFQTIVGAILVVAGFIAATSFIFAPLAPYLISAGATMMIGGLIQLIAPAPRLDTQPEDTNPEASKYISGTGNTTKSGTRIPLGYGTFIHYGHIVSLNVNSKELASGAANGYVYGNSAFDGDGNLITYTWHGVPLEFN